MMKGYGSAGGQRAQGMICQLMQQAATEASGPWCRIVINEDPEFNRQGQWLMNGQWPHMVHPAAPPLAIQGIFIHRGPYISLIFIHWYAQIFE